MNSRAIGIVLSLLFALVVTGCTSLYTGTKKDKVTDTDSNSNGSGTGELEGWEPIGTPVTVTETNSANARRPWATIYFAYDQSSIGEAERAKLNKISEYLRNNPKFDLLVEGHCDDRGSEEYNRSLGERRAIAVQEYLVRVGLPKNRVRTLSFGEEKPASKGSDPQARQLNRRAELIVIAAKTTIQ